MRITKFGHSCVRLGAAGRDVVVDPGGWSEREALDGVAAVLVSVGLEMADMTDGS